MSVLTYEHFAARTVVSIFLIDGVAGDDEGIVNIDPIAIIFNPDFGEVAAIFSAPVFHCFNEQGSERFFRH